MGTRFIFQKQLRAASRPHTTARLIHERYVIRRRHLATIGETNLRKKYGNENQKWMPILSRMNEPQNLMISSSHDSSHEPTIFDENYFRTFRVILF